VGERLLAQPPAKVGLPSVVLSLVTRNLREFRRVKGLRIEDWY
jgi:hypothetical protein